MKKKSRGPMTTVELCCLLMLLVLGAANDVSADHEERLHPIKGDCSLVEPIFDISPFLVNGKEWVIVLDSSLDNPKDTCETLSLTWVGGFLYAHETIANNDGYIIDDVEIVYGADEVHRGIYFEEDGGIAILFAVDERANAVCFVECGSIGRRFGAHVLCGTKTGRVSKTQDEIIEQARAHLPSIGIDLQLKPLRIDCDDFSKIRATDP